MAYIKCFPIKADYSVDDIEEVFEEYGEIQQTLFSTEFGNQRVAIVEFVNKKSADKAVAVRFQTCCSFFVYNCILKHF